MGSANSKPEQGQKNALSLAAPSSGFPAPSGGRRRSNRYNNKRGRGKTMRGGQSCSKMYGGMHKGKRHSKGSRKNKSNSKSRSKSRRHH